MNKKFYIFIPLVIFSIIVINAFFGHLIFDFGSEGDINKYSVYIHLQPEWQSYPKNIIFDVTTVWTNPESSTNNPFFDPEVDVQLKTEYNVNELQYVNEKSYVELKHEFSDCKNDWKPILYRRGIDTVRSHLSNLMGTQLNSEPYAAVYPTIQNNEYDISEQKSKLDSGYSHFVPICTSKEVTSYDFSVKMNDEKLGFDVYFVPSISELENYRQNNNFDFYKQNSCYGNNLQSFSGTCNQVEKNSGLLIIVPDELHNSLTKIVVNLKENVI